MADIQLRSLQNLISSMVSRLIAETDVNDVSPGSLTLTLIEAAASSDFQQEAKLLQLLAIRNVDRASGVDLENLAAEWGLTPSRIGATSARVFVDIIDTSFDRVSTTIYAGAPAPVAGDTKIHIVNGAQFLTTAASGTLYVGRGTQTSETVSYTSVVDAGSYWTFNLASAIEKDHLIGEEIVLSQGGDRSVGAQTAISTQAGGMAAPIQFLTVQEQRLLDGENTLKSVEAVASVPGISGNVAKGKINQFVSPPWSTASVVNPNPASGGRDVETDVELRERIKDRVHVLSAGTERAIIRAVIGQQDDSENKRVVSAYLKKPTGAQDETILYIDDGFGFAPSFSGVSEESVVTSASGTERYFQLQRWPVVKAQIPTVGIEPFVIKAGSTLRFEVDGASLEKELFATDFAESGKATIAVSAQQVAEEINKTFASFVEARAKNGQVFATPFKQEPDWIRVGTPSGENANSVLKFPTTRQYTVKLYKNDVLLEKNGSEALIQTKPRGQWGTIPSSGRLQLKVDGIAGPIITLTDAIFDNIEGVSADKMDDASVFDWVIVINKLFIGIKAEALDDGSLIIKSNKGRSQEAAVEAIDLNANDDLSVKMFPANSAGVGKAPQFKLNRLTGQIELSDPLSKGDSLKAGSMNTRGATQGSTNSVFDLSSVYGSPAEFVLVADGLCSKIEVGQTGTWTFSSPFAGVQRVSATPGKFSNVQIGDIAHLYSTPRNDGGTIGVLLMVKDVDPSGTYVDFFDGNPKSGTVAMDGINRACSFFRTSALPQLVRLPVGPNITSAQITNAINTQCLGLSAEILDSGRIQVTTHRFDGARGLSVPSVKGRAIGIGLKEGNYASNDPHTATIESLDLAGFASGRIAATQMSVASPYTNLVSSTSSFTDDDSNRPIVGYFGSSARVVRQPKDLVSGTEIEFRNEKPYPTAELGQDFVGAAYTGVEFGSGDNMVFIIDNDPDKKTYNIPMYIEATVAGPFSPTAEQFDATDSSGDLLGSSLRWKGYRLEDYRAWLQAKSKIVSSAPNADIRLKSVEFGPNGTLIRAGFIYPQLPNQSLKSSFDINAITGKITVQAVLASGADRAIGLLPNRRVDLAVSGNDVTMKFLPPVSLSTVQVGDIVSISDPAFSAAAQGAYRISSIDNFVDTGNAFQYDQGTPASGPNPPIPRVPFKLTAANLPSFTVQPGDRIQVGSHVVTVSSVIDQQTYMVDQDNLWAGLLSGSVSRLNLKTKRYSAVSSQTAQVAASQSIRVYELPSGANSASAIIEKINNTAGVKDLIEASNAIGSDGSGSIVKSTEDELANGERFVSLKNGEGFVFETKTTSPALRLKFPLPAVLEYGDKVRFIPQTAQNVKDHLSKKQISGLSVVANVDLVDQGRKLQVSSKTPGGLGQVYAVGGRALGESVLPIRGSSQEISSTRASFELDRSNIEFLAPGQTIKISQPFVAPKRWTAGAPTQTDTVQIELEDSVTGKTKLTLSAPIASTLSYTQGVGVVKWAVVNLGRSVTRFEKISGTASIPSSLKAGDWVFVGDGTSYAGYPTTPDFSSGNRGWKRILATDNSRYFDIEDGSAVEEIVDTKVTSFIFTPYHSARPGDQVRIGFDTPLETSNRGSYIIEEVTSEFELVYTNKKAVDEGPVALGPNGAPAIAILDQGYSTYRKVVVVAPKPGDPAQRSVVVVEPGYDMSLVSENQGARVELPLRLGFNSDPVAGVNGYNFWTGLKRRVQRVVDGLASDPATFPGVAAAGVSIEVREPQITRVSCGLKIKTGQGVSLSSIGDSIKSSIAGYINSLGLGEDVILSEVIRIAQEVPGVEAIVLQSPSPTGERIVVGDNSIARISTSDINLS